MDRQEFDRTVKAMQDEGVPLTMANLMVRTELPRATIESWLDDMQRDIKVRPAPPREKPRDAGDGSLADRARALRSELLSEAVKSQLGVGKGTVDSAEKPRRDIKTGGIIGLILPPAGLLYSAPVPVGIVGTVAYLVLAAVAWKFFMLGGLYILTLMHLAGGTLGVAYAWRFNRKGRRTQLLPAAEKRTP